MTDLHLKQAVQSALSSFLEQRRSTHDDIAQEVYRALRDEANLLLERELICSSLDSDPFGLVRAVEGEDDSGEETDEKRKNSEMIARVKDLLQVVSCTRTATAEGYSFIQAVVQLNNDGKMQGVSKNVRLRFSFLREPQRRDDGDDSENKNLFYADANEYFQSDEDSVGCSSRDENNRANGKRKRPDVSSKKIKKDDEEDNEMFDDNQAKKQKKVKGSRIETMRDDDEKAANSDNFPDESGNDGFKPKTIITYKVEYSIDYGKAEKLFGINIYAAGEFPSVHEAIPMMEGDEDASDAGSDGDDNVNAKGNSEDAGAGENEPQANGSKFEDIEMSSDGEPDNESMASKPGSDVDRFGAFVDPEHIVAFLDRLNMNFNEISVFSFLLMFPFYEHEWNISGFLLSSLFDEEDDEGAEGEEWGGMCLPCNDNE